MKTYPLVVEPLHDMDNGGTLSYYSMGHHDPQAFVDAVAYSWQDKLPAENVRHGYARKVPAQSGQAVDWLLIECRKGRGAFPVTQVEL